MTEHSRCAHWLRTDV